MPARVLGEIHDHMASAELPDGLHPAHRLFIAFDAAPASAWPGHADANQVADLDIVAGFVGPAIGRLDHLVSARVAAQMILLVLRMPGCQL